VTIQIGDDAPDFELKDNAGNDVRLSDFRGKRNVVLVFFPFTFTGVCQGELCELRDDLSSFETSDARVLAISCDSRHAQARWAAEQRFSFPLLSDFWPHGEVSRRYGVFNEAVGCANRATFVIDKGGRVVDTFATAQLGTPRDKANYEAALSKLG
jgi:mycoredoxin-dependent peroxiredoxin